MDSVRQPDSAQRPPIRIAVDFHDLVDRCLGRLDLAERILQKFQITLEEDIRRLEEAVCATSTAEIAHIAHRIKGASLAVAAHDLTDCARSLENSANLRSLEDLPVHFARLKQESARLDDLRVTIVPENSSC